MTVLWPWLAVAGLGIVHGLNPASGWMFAAACGVHARDGAVALRTLWPIAAGHVAAIAWAAGAFAFGMSLDRDLVQQVAGASLVAIALYRLARRPGTSARISATATQAGIAAWCFFSALAHGAGLMLIPALMPLCVTGDAARGIALTDSAVVAMAAVGVHTAAMLVTSGLIAAGVYRGFARHLPSRDAAGRRRAWTAMLACVGVTLLALR